MRTQFLALALAVTAAPLAAQHRPVGTDDSLPAMQKLKLDGPRVGATLISGARAMQRLQDRGLQPFMTIVGWISSRSPGRGPADRASSGRACTSGAPRFR